MSQVCVFLYGCVHWGLPFVNCLSISHKSWFLSVIILVGTYYICSCIYMIIMFCWFQRE